MEIYAGIAVMNDGTTKITSGTLMECAKWADDIMRESDIKEIVIKVVPK